MSMSYETRDISVINGLERCECLVGVEVGDLRPKSRRIDLRLSEKVGPGN